MVKEKIGFNETTCLLKMVILITLSGKVSNLFSKNNEIVVKTEMNFVNAFKEVIVSIACSLLFLDL